MYKFGDRSLKNLNTAHLDLQIVMKEALKTSMVDFGVSEGHRSIERQQKLFKEGKSRIDGVKRKGKHNYSPSLAVDIYAYVDGGNSKYTFDKVHLAYLGGHIMAVANKLYADGTVKHQLRWGGNWDGDGTLLFDQKLWDMPHFELIV
jgi:peptidoglycan L-alanyl-D-glutamate endopeptidase CwlK